MDSNTFRPIALKYRKSHIRFNGFYQTYVEIAIKSYSHMKKSLQVLEEASYICNGETGQAYDDLQKNIIITIVFAAMAIESYINDYAAACVNDEDYYECFDKLSVLDKLQLVSLFVFQVEFNKDQAVFTHIKDLFKDRNNFVHNKSMRSDLFFRKHGVTISERSEVKLQNQEDLEGNPNSATYNPSELKADIGKAKNAIKALKHLARFIEAHDETENASFALLRAQFFKDDMQPDEVDRLAVYREFQIPYRIY